MRRRDFGMAALAGLGAATLGRPGEALAADTKVRGAETKAKATKGSDKKFYVLPSSKVSLKPGMRVTFVYKGETDGAQGTLHTFELVTSAAGTGSVEFSVEINGSPTTALDEAPPKIYVIDAAGTHPIDVQQPGS